METTPNDGGPAFPKTVWGRTQCNEPVQITEGGMSLRDWFAGQAMQGILSSDDFSDSEAKDVARWSYQHADAMLKARSKP